MGILFKERKSHDHTLLTHNRNKVHIEGNSAEVKTHRTQLRAFAADDQGPEETPHPVHGFASNYFLHGSVSRSHDALFQLHKAITMPVILESTLDADSMARPHVADDRSYKHFESPTVFSNLESQKFDKIKNQQSSSSFGGSIKSVKEIDDANDVFNNY